MGGVKSTACFLGIELKTKAHSLVAVFIEEVVDVTNDISGKVVVVSPKVQLFVNRSFCLR